MAAPDLKALYWPPISELWDHLFSLRNGAAAAAASSPEHEKLLRLYSRWLAQARVLLRDSHHSTTPVVQYGSDHVQRAGLCWVDHRTKAMCGLRAVLIRLSPPLRVCAAGGRPAPSRHGLCSRPPARSSILAWTEFPSRQHFCQRQRR